METPSWLELGGDLWRHETKRVKTEATARFWKETWCRFQMSHRCNLPSVHVLRGLREAIPSVTPD